MLVAGAGAPISAKTVHALGEEEAEEREKEPCNFEPEDAASVNEGSPDGLAELFGAFFCSFESAFAASGIGGSILPNVIRTLRGAIAQHS